MNCIIENTIKIRKRGIEMEDHFLDKSRIEFLMWCLERENINQVTIDKLNECIQAELLKFIKPHYRVIMKEMRDQ